jgi:hypothetical protein
MEPRAKWRSRQGLLLVEASLSAVIIAVGLVFIARGLSTQLKALRTIEAYGGLTAAAESQLFALESVGMFAPPLPANRGGLTLPEQGAFAPLIEVRPRPELIDAAGQELLSDLIVTVEEAGRPSSRTRLHSIWATGNLPEEWI